MTSSRLSVVLPTSDIKMKVGFVWLRFVKPKWFSRSHVLADEEIDHLGVRWRMRYKM